MTNTVFTHRPKAGVSVGARNVNGVLYVAFALTNDGTSSNGIFWKERRDTFSRATARMIINGRIDHAVSVENVTEVDSPLVLSFETDVTAHQFIMAFRQTFKPTTDETDDFLSFLTSDLSDDEQETIRQLVEGLEPVARFRPTANMIVSRLTHLVNEIINHESASI
jgi:hypothetical protein